MLEAFTAGLLLITISELGDKTFFIAVILAMRHAHGLVLSAVIAALAAMTILSVFLGQAVSLLPKTYVHYGEIILFVLMGIKLLIDAWQMSPDAADDVEKEAEAAISQESHSPASGLSQFFQRYPNVGLWSQAFTLTFLAEWGDRTQFSTIALAAAKEPIGVTLGAILGHSICAVIAVLGGKLIAGRISERLITAIGGVLFIVFGVVAIFQPL